MKLSLINEEQSNWIDPDYILGINSEDSITFIYTEHTGLFYGSGNITHGQLFRKLIAEVKYDYDSRFYNDPEILKLYQILIDYMDKYYNIAINGRLCTPNLLFETHPNLTMHKFDLFPETLEKIRNNEDAGYLVSVWWKNQLIAKCVSELYSKGIVSDPVYISTPDDGTKLWRGKLSKQNPWNQALKDQNLLGPGQSYWRMHSEDCK